MKTYLNEEEFLAVVWHELDLNLGSDYPTGASDKIVYYLFRQFDKEVNAALKSAMYGIEEYQGDDAADLIGHQFHKAFRQVDPIDAPYFNHIIWTCLTDAPIFWKCLNRACKILVSKELADYFKESYTMCTN